MTRSCLTPDPIRVARTALHRLVLGTLLGLAAASAAQATSFQVGATILVSCTVSGTALSFGGSVDPLLASGPVDASAALAVVCTNTTPYTLALNAGVNAGGGANFGARTLKHSNGSAALPYQLYLDAGRSKVWGDGANAYSGTGTGNAQSVTIYGRLPSLAGAVPGNYSDTVTVTVSY
ncbi:spore coat protein U domain-containing protein [Roseateles sp. DAIF2]|uniref:Csu type fimbrial protein n=1 Tax=Roseateles sp. DAIF2 TaxID=2714952 RepID=UPI0018A27FEB|nr:spore coat U domain-containing protein [Roseateles sp. DAIF2]QPF75051.1 spore coat protein U domain-containing protein [Roseateles sp. DAIF2]